MTVSQVIIIPNAYHVFDFSFFFRYMHKMTLIALTRMLIFHLLFTFCLSFTTSPKDADSDQDGCNFPMTIQNGALLGDVWMTNVIDQGWKQPYSAYLKVKFQGGHMTSRLHTGENAIFHPEPYSLACLNETEGGYFVSRSQNGSISYSCMDVILRSVNVFQIRHSDWVESGDASMCKNASKNLTDKWAFVRSHKNIRCPKVGGYNLDIVLNGNKVCDRNVGAASRLEGGCLTDGSIEFVFGSGQGCSPKQLGLDMMTQQKTLCLATWEQESFTFVVLTKNSERSFWVLRYPVRHVTGSELTFNLLKNVVIDANEPLGPDTNGITLVGKKTISSSFCVDTRNDCESLSPKERCNSIQSSGLPYPCMKTCSQCTEKQECSFSPEYRGIWLGRTRQESFSINITKDQFIMKQNKSIHLRCLKNMKSVGSHLKIVVYEMFENGCRPQLSCMVLDLQNNAVLRYKIGSSVLWPDTAESACDETRFFGQSALSLQFTAKYFRHVVAFPNTHRAPCRLRGKLYFHTTVPGAGSCSGILAHGGCNKQNQVTVTYMNCTETIVPAPETFICKYSYVGSPFQYIISTSSTNQNRSQCLALKYDTKHTSYPSVLITAGFYLTDVSDCLVTDFQWFYNWRDFHENKIYHEESYNCYDTGSPPSKVTDSNAVTVEVTTHTYVNTTSGMEIIHLRNFAMIDMFMLLIFHFGS